MRILLRTCPARLKDPGSTCTKVYLEARSKLKTVLGAILEKGIASGEFAIVEIGSTANMMIALFNGLMRQQIARMDDLDGVELVTIEFCRKALLIDDDK